MTRKQYKRLKLFYTVTVLVLLILLIGIMILGLYNEKVYNMFLSEGSTAEVPGLSNDGPLISYLIGFVGLLIASLTRWVYKKRYKYEQKAGIIKNVEKKRNTFISRAFYIFLAVSIINFLVSAVLIYLGLFLRKNDSVIFENIMLISIALLPVNSAMAIGFGLTRKYNLKK